MIEGLRVYPAFKDSHAKKEALGGRSCEECKRTVDTVTRQQLGCGYEPAIAKATPWMPPSWAERGLSLSTCPGYTTSLPLVLEIVQAYPHWEQGALRAYLGGKDATPTALDLFTLLRAGKNEHDSDKLRARGEGGR